MDTQTIKVMPMCYMDGAYDDEPAGYLAQGHHNAYEFLVMVAIENGAMWSAIEYEEMATHVRCEWMTEEETTEGDAEVRFHFYDEPGDGRLPVTRIEEDHVAYY